MLIPHVAAEFSTCYPDVELDVPIADTEKTIVALLEGEIEVAVVGRQVHDPRLRSRAIDQDELTLIVAASDALSSSEVVPEDLRGRPFVMREEESATRQAAEEVLAAAGIVPRVAMELGSNGGVVAAVAEGARIGVVLVRTLSSDVRGLSFVRPFVLVVERNRKLSPSAEAFVSMCLGEEKEL